MTSRAISWGMIKKRIGSGTCELIFNFWSVSSLAIGACFWQWLYCDRPPTLTPSCASKIRINNLTGLAVHLLFQPSDFLGKLHIGSLVVDDQARKDLSHADQHPVVRFSILLWPRSDVVSYFFAVPVLHQRGQYLIMMILFLSIPLNSSAILSSFFISLYLNSR